ncbi:MAG TPA: leucyl aminopeptidase, partial [Blastocatellia bacterium]|nr:leucyl aminopeptidase [Blastocatellia bacterium]
MEIKAELSKFHEVASDVLAVTVFEGEKGDQGILKDLNDRCGGIVSDVISSGELKGKPGDAVLVHRPGNIAARRLLLLGGGNSQTPSVDSVSKSAGAAVRYLKGKGAKSVAFLLRGATAATAQAAAEGAILALYEPDTYKTREKDAAAIERFSVIPESGAAGDLAAGLQSGTIIAEAMNLARNLSNEPSSSLTPTALAEQARQTAKKSGLEIEVLEKEQMAELGMGGLLGVARGSDEPPKLIVLTYVPSGATGDEVIAVVGKGITFDSGGISIKHADGMEQMKYDMTGAANTLAILSAIGQLKPGVKVIGLMPACENMPSGHAYKPGDVLRAMNGKTIEIVNTDAEGRLILADAIAYARKLGATRIIDMATLTGAVMVALASVNTGLLGNDQRFIDEIRQSGQEIGEKLWPLPMDPEYRELIKSDIADMKNSGGRYGGAITASMLLSEFAETTPWVHLDIAG